MLTRVEFYQSALLKVRYVACRSADAGLSGEETSDAPELVMPVRGIFAGHFSRRYRVLAEPNSALLLLPEHPYRVSHPVAVEDDCVVFEFSNTGFHRFLEELSLDQKDVYSGICSLLSPAAKACRNLLLNRLKQEVADSIEVEETAVSLLNHTLTIFAKNTRTRLDSVYRGKQLIESMDAVRIALLQNPGERWTLTEIAGLVKVSPYYLTRMFQKHYGVPLHSYLLHTRIAKAIELLLDSDDDLIDIAFSLGFSSHSHFTYAFRRLTKLTPHEFRNSIIARKSPVHKVLLNQLS